MTRTAHYPDLPSRIHLNANRDLRFQLALGRIVLNFYSRFNGLADPSFPPSPSLRAEEEGGSGDQIVHSMYVFSLNRPSTDRWECIAEPVRERTSSFFYFMDDTGVIRFAIGAMPSAASPPLS